MNTDRRPLLFITAGIFTFVSLFSVLLRFIARRTARLSLYWDDWLIAASLVCLYGSSMLLLIHQLIFKSRLHGLWASSTSMAVYAMGKEGIFSIRQRMI